MRKAAVLATVAALALAGCGGGGGGGSGDAPAPAAKTPTVTISLSAAKVAVNAPLTITWTSTDSTSCVGSDSLPATQPVNGSTSITQTAGGQYTYTITCTGVGGSANAKATAIVPMRVFTTSYENKNAIPFDATQVPRVRALGLPKVVVTEQDSVDRSIAIGDFFQEGKYSAFIMTTNSDGRYGGNPTIPGVGYFLSQSDNGTWIDRSSLLFKDTSDRMGCISPSRTAVADFNNDGKPDVYVACTGFDFDVPNATTEQNQAFSRSFSVIYLSQSDGSYKSTRIEENNPMYGHKAVAVDLNGDRNIDIVTSDLIDPSQPIGCGTPFVLLGRGDGTFTRNYTFLDANFVRNQLPQCGFFDVDIIPIDGRHDIMISGLDSSGNWEVLWLNGKIGGFDLSTAKLFKMPKDPASNSEYQFPLDIIYDLSSLGFYMKTTLVSGYGSVWSVIKFDKSGSLVGIIDRWANTGLAQSPQFKPSKSSPGYLVAYSAGCAADVTLGDCGRKVKMN